MKTRFVFIFLFTISSFTKGYGQKTLDSTSSGFGILTDSTYSGYKDKGGLGGPTSIEAQLELENQVNRKLDALSLTQAPLVDTFF